MPIPLEEFYETLSAMGPQVVFHLATSPESGWNNEEREAALAWLTQHDVASRQPLGIACILWIAFAVVVFIAVAKAVHG
jgi:hypothetical protein